MKYFKYTIAIVLLLLVNSLYSQEFVKNYQIGLNTPYNAVFSCITTKNVMGNHELFTAGPFTDRQTGQHGIGIVRLDFNGNILDDVVIKPDVDTYDYTPTAILYEPFANVAEHVIEDIVTICGYYQSSGAGYGFVMRYNYTAGTMVWFNELTDISAFFDMEEYDGDFVVCGHQSSPVDGSPLLAQEMVVLKVGRTTGIFGDFNRERWTPFSTEDESSDSYYAMDFNLTLDDPIVLSSRITNSTGNLMKPNITSLDNTGASIDEQFFLSADDEDSRLYGNDIAWSVAEEELYMIVSGDVDGSNLYEDDYIVKYPYLGGTMLGKKFDFTDAKDGNFNSLKLFTNGSGAIFPIVYGFRYVSGVVSDVYLFRTNAALTTIGWGRSFPNIRCIPNTPNSMIVVGNDIFTVGFTFVTDHNEPVLIRRPLAATGECGDEYVPTISSATDQYLPELNNPERDLDEVELEWAYTLIPTDENTICEEMKLANSIQNTHPTLLIQNQTSHVIDFVLEHADITTSYFLEVYNLMGQLVFKQNLSFDGPLSVYLEHGLYGCRLIGNNSVVDEKMFVSM